VGKKYTIFTIERIVALRSVNKIFPESYDFAANFLRESAACDWCDHHLENSFHFFFKCPEFADHRTKHLSSINEMQLPIPLTLDLLLHGEKCLSFTDNEKVFEIDQKYTLNVSL
jgi:hypothetical protein